MVKNCQRMILFYGCTTDSTSCDLYELVILGWEILTVISGYIQVGRDLTATYDHIHINFMYLFLLPFHLGIHEESTDMEIWHRRRPCAL